MSKLELRRRALRRLCDKLGRGGVKKVAEAIGKSESYVSRMLSDPKKDGHRPIMEDTADLISKRFPGWLETDYAPPAAVAARADSEEVVIVQYDAGGSMGQGRLVLEHDQPGIIKSWNVDRQWLNLNVKHYTSEGNLCIVTGFGPSMTPKYNPGDPLLMDMGVKTVEFDGVYFFRVGELAYIKQLQRIPTERGLIIRAKSYNPDFESFDITKKMDFEVLGKILTIWKSEQVY